MAAKKNKSKIKSYSLYYSEAQKRASELGQTSKVSAADPSFPGVYTFTDSRTGKQFVATEFVADSYILGFRLRGRPSYKDAKFVTHIKADAIGQLRRIAL